MKMLKKLFTLVAALVMCLTLTATLISADEGYTVTINRATGTYEIYQVFTGDLSENGTTLSNVKWGKDVTKFSVNGTSDATKIAEYLSDDNSDAEEFAATAIANVKENSNSGTKTATDGKVEFTGLTAGYYVVKNTEVGTSESYTKYILQVVKNVTIDSKSDVPTSQKKVLDTNDTTGETTGWQDSADYDIGDEVPFQLTGTVASNYADYDKYYFAFHDVESEGLTFNKDSVKVYIDDTETNGYEVVTTGGGFTDDCTFHVVFADLKKTNAKANSTVTVEYTSTLNESAKIGAEGNPNEMYLEFSNNPNESQGGKKGPTGETPHDKVIVFTYQTIVNKVDQDTNPLAGAEFTLTKEVKNGEPVVLTTVAIGADDSAEAIKNKFVFKGLDDGEYTLTETVTPDGYNTMEPVTFSISATHDVKSDDPKLTSLSGVDNTTTLTFSSNVNAGSLTTDVVNKKGTVLPSTGGIGTTIFYVTGAILMLGAGVMLVSRKSASK